MTINQFSFLRSLLRTTMSFLPESQEPPIEVIATADRLPKEERTHALPGADVTYYQYSFGTVFTQKCVVAGYLFWYHRFTIHQPVILQPLASNLLVTLHYMLKGNVRCEMNGQQLTLVENRYQVFALAEGQAYRADFQPGLYESFHVALRYDLIPELATAYSDLNTLLESLRTGFSGAHDPNLFLIHPALLKCIREILDYRGAMTEELRALRQLYWEERIIRLINFYITEKEAWQKQQARIQAAPLHLDKLEAYISEYLVDADNTSESPLSIATVTKQLGMNEQRFRIAMIERFGRSWEVYLNDIRMKRAMEWVQASPHQPISHIAYQLGYSRPANFTRAFTKYYGHYPNYYRKDNNH